MVGAEIARQRRIHDLVPLYVRLTELVDFYSSWEVVPFTTTAADICANLKKQKIKVGTQDLKIASSWVAGGGLAVCLALTSSM